MLLIVEAAVLYVSLRQRYMYAHDAQGTCGQLCLTQYERVRNVVGFPRDCIAIP